MNERDRRWRRLMRKTRKTRNEKAIRVHIDTRKPKPKPRINASELPLHGDTHQT